MTTPRDEIERILAPAIDARAPYAKVMIDLIAELVPTWQSIETGPIDEPVLVAHPQEGRLPVIAWKIEDSWWEFGPYGRELRPQPTVWLRWPKLQRPSR